MVNISAYKDTISAKFSYSGRLFATIYYDENVLDIVVNDFVMKGELKKFYGGYQGTKVHKDSLSLLSGESYRSMDVSLNPDPLQIDFVKLDNVIEDTTYILFTDALPIHADLVPPQPSDPPPPPVNDPPSDNSNDGNDGGGSSDDDGLTSMPVPVITLDLDRLDGDQSLDSLAISRTDTVDIQIFGTHFQAIDNLFLRFEYDAAQVVYEGLRRGSGISGTSAISGKDFVSVEMTLSKENTMVDSSLMGTIRFRTTETFSGTDIRLARLRVISAGDDDTYPQNKSVNLSLNPLKTGDFNGDGNVDIKDFLLWLEAFGTQRGKAGYDKKYDLDGDGTVGVSDFLIFVENFGK